MCYSMGPCCWFVKGYFILFRLYRFLIFIFSYGCSGSLLWDLSSPTRSQTRALCTEYAVLATRPPRKSMICSFFKINRYLCPNQALNRWESSIPPLPLKSGPLEHLAVLVSSESASGDTGCWSGSCPSLLPRLSASARAPHTLLCVLPFST